jgi:hypothetical protein
VRFISLTQELRKADSPISRFFHERFAHIAPIVRRTNAGLRSAKTLYPLQGGTTPPYSTIGTAIDYRLMYYFGITKYIDLEAFKGASTTSVGNPRDRVGIRLQPTLFSAGGNIQVTRLTFNFFTSLERVLQRTRPVRQRLEPDDEAALCRHCFVLALFSEIRGHPLPPHSPLVHFTDRPEATVADLLALADPWVTDLCQLSWLFFDSQQVLFDRQAWPHPKNIWQMAGAAADLWAGGYILDVKTTTTPKLDVAWLYQVLGYVLLRYPEHQPVRGVGIYLARQGILVRWELNEVLLCMMGVPTPPLEELSAAYLEVLRSGYSVEPVRVETFHTSNKHPYGRPVESG